MNNNLDERYKKLYEKIKNVPGSRQIISRNTLRNRPGITINEPLDSSDQKFVRAANRDKRLSMVSFNVPISEPSHQEALCTEKQIPDSDNDNNVGIERLNINFEPNISIIKLKTPFQRNSS